MLSAPTLSKTFGVTSPEAISDSRSPDAPARPVKPKLSACVKAGPATFSLRNSSEEAKATLAVPEAAAGLLLLDEDAGLLLLEAGDELPQAASPMQVMDSKATNRAPFFLVMAIIP
jgi:hypothetical protein